MPTEEWIDFDETLPTPHSLEYVLTHELLKLRRNDERKFKRAVLVPLGLAAVASALKIETRG